MYDIKFLLIIGIAFMLILLTSFLVITLHNQRKKWQMQQEMNDLKQQQQNQLIEAAVRSEETERHRIAEALHDEVGAILSSTKLHLQGIKHDNLNEKDKKLYEKSKELLDEGIQKVRGISHNLHSNILKEFGLNEAIRHFIKKVAQSGIMEATTSLDDNYVTQNPENDISIYRMVQEIINNIMKHAEASQITVNSEYKSNSLNLIITHNGKGLSQQQFEELRYSKDGLGLKNIQNRVILLKGTIAFSAKPNDNLVSIFIPLQTPAI